MQLQIYNVKFELNYIMGTPDSKSASKVSIRVVSLWNSLPEKVALAPTLNQFKTEFDKHFSNSPQLYNFDEPLQTRPT